MLIHRIVFKLYAKYFRLNYHFRVLKVELETYKIRVKVLQEENRTLRQASVIIVSVYYYPPVSAIRHQLIIIKKNILLILASKS